MEDLKPVLESLWAPWRVEYYETKDRDPDFLRNAGLTSNDAEHLVIFRRKSAFLMMNRYPYTAGHLMAVPYQKVHQLEMLESGERLELLNLAIYAQKLLQEVVKAEGFNIGWNIGSAAGAGMKDHLHLHIVPRWGGDHNYMAVLGNTRVIPQGLEPLYERLCAAVASITYPD